MDRQNEGWPDQRRLTLESETNRKIDVSAVIKPTDKNEDRLSYRNQSQNAAVSKGSDEWRSNHGPGFQALLNV